MHYFPLTVISYTQILFHSSGMTAVLFSKRGKMKVGKRGGIREKLGRERTGNPKKGHLSKGPSKAHFAETNL